MIEKIEKERKNEKEKKTITKSAENGHRKHHLHPFSQNISGKLAAPLLRETGKKTVWLHPMPL